MHRIVLLTLLGAIGAVRAKSCQLKPLGNGHDDTDSVLAAVQRCSKNSVITFAPGSYNITKKMNWDLENTHIDLLGTLNFAPNVEYWLNASNTYRVVFIQNQASWFVITGTNFTIDAHGKGGINGNGQVWWNYFANRTRLDGDGRPIAFTLSNTRNALVRNFRIEAQPFWCNTVADSNNVTYDGMYCNATNTNPAYAGTNLVPNTDGINTYRSDTVSMKNWDITCGDDCLAIKGNSTNVYAGGITCRGGNGIAIGSLGQYEELPDIVNTLTMENLSFLRLNASVQPNMQNGVYFKTWTGTAHGVPPTAGGGGYGEVRDVIVRNVHLDRVNIPLHLYQTNNGKTGDVPSQIQFSNLTFENWSGTANTNKIVDLECSIDATCPDIHFKNFYVTPPNATAPRYICINTEDVSGLDTPCNATGSP